MTANATNSYNESMQYDKNGNILNLQRNGNYDDSVYNLQIDNLSYFYDTSLSNLNRLMKVTDLSNDPTGFKDDSNGSNDIADDYSYDANGNMATDQNKGITSIKYNIFNLPTEIIFSNNSTKKINYIYNAVGVKIRKIVTNGTVVSTTDYLNGFQYYKATSAAVAALKYIPTAEGYVSVTTSGTTNSYNYVFTYKDHLGNVRVSYGFGPTSTNTTPATYILQESNYYPFGLQHSNYNVDKLTYDDNIANGIGGTLVVPPLNYPMNKYKYNGKELQDELGLNMYDYGARNYDPALGRWMNMDLLVEKTRRFSPYTYAMNNPIYFVDVDGMYADANGNERNDGVVYRGGHWSDAIREQNGTFTSSDGKTTAKADEPNGESKKEDAASQVGLSSESFDFQETTSNWQAAGVTGLSLTVQDPLRRVAEVDFELEIGLPIKLANGTVISERIAQISSAQAANETAAIIATMADLSNGKFYKAPALVKQTFATLMQRNLNKAIIENMGLTKGTKVGSRVNSSIQSNITTKEAVWNNVSTYEAIKVWMKSWF